MFRRLLTDDRSITLPGRPYMAPRIKRVKE
jgi:hypothetical protein